MTTDDNPEGSTLDMLLAEIDRLRDINEALLRRRELLLSRLEDMIAPSKNLDDGLGAGILASNKSDSAHTGGDNADEGRPAGNQEG